MFHEDGHHHVDQDELSHQDEDNKEERSHVLVDTAVAETVIRGVTLLSQRVLHDPVPVVPCGLSHYQTDLVNQSGPLEVREMLLLPALLCHKDTAQGAHVFMA